MISSIVNNGRIHHCFWWKRSRIEWWTIRTWELAQVSCLRCPRHLRISVKKHHSDNFTKWALTIRENIFQKSKLFILKITSIWPTNMRQCKKMGEKFNKKVEIVTCALFYGFFGKIMPFFITFCIRKCIFWSYCSLYGKNFFTKLLAIWIANFYLKKHYLFKKISWSFISEIEGKKLVKKLVFSYIWNMLQNLHFQNFFF
jgi:hypothetical protein